MSLTAPKPTKETTKLARSVVRTVVEFLTDEHDEDLAVNGLDRRNRERLVKCVAGTLAANRPKVITLTVRDPDYENTHTTDLLGDVEVEEFDVDLGSSFNGIKYFYSDLGEDGAEEWLEEHRQMVAHLPETSAVRRAVEHLCDFLEDRHD